MDLQRQERETLGMICARKMPALLVGFMLLGHLRVGLADLPPPEPESVCANAKADDPCALSDGQSGRCVDATCSKLDYSQGTPPQSVEYSCLRCDAVAASAVAEQPDAAPERAPAEPPPEPPVSESRCSIGVGNSPIGLVVGLSVAFWCCVRRRGTPV